MPVETWTVHLLSHTRYGTVTRKRLFSSQNRNTVCTEAASTNNCSCSTAMPCESYEVTGPQQKHSRRDTRLQLVIPDLVLERGRSANRMQHLFDPLKSPCTDSIRDGCEAGLSLGWISSPSTSTAYEKPHQHHQWLWGNRDSPLVWLQCVLSESAGCACPFCASSCV